MHWRERERDREREREIERESRRTRTGAQINERLHGMKIEEIERKDVQ